MVKRLGKSKKPSYFTALIANFLITLVLSAVFIISSQASARSGFRDINTAAAKTAAEIINARLISAFDTLNNSENILGTGEILKTGSELTLTYTYGGEIYNADYFRGFSFDRQHNIFTVKRGDIYLTALSLTNIDSHSVIILKDSALSEFIDSLNFENVLLLDDTGKVLGSASEYQSAYYTLNPHLNISDGIFKNSGSDFYAVNTLEDYGLRALCIISADSVKDFVDRSVSYSTIYVIAMIITALLGSAFLFLAILTGDFKSFYRESKVYVLTADNTGRLLSADRGFKKNFDIRNIFDYVYDKRDLVVNATDGHLILMLVTDDNKPAYLRFKSHFDGKIYTLVGYDVTDLFTQLIDTQKLLNCDMVTGLQHDLQFKMDFKQASEESLFEKFAVALVEVANSATLKRMFGNDTFFKIQKSVAATLTELYSPQIRVYYSIEDKYILFADNSLRADILTANLNKAVANLQAPMTVNDNTIKPVVKAGISIIKEKPDYSTAFRDAKIALNYAKLSQTRPVQIYDPRVMKSALIYFETKESIMELINSDKLQVHYQPQYDTKLKKIVGFEALTRINSPEFKNISVHDFIEAAEQNGAIIELGSKIYSIAMDFAKKIEASGVALSLNVSPIQLMQDGFTEKFLQKYKSLELKSGSINIEITESFLMQSYDDIINKLLLFKKEGIGIHLDDFGTEYSSMLNLNKLPITTIKIDREFVRDILNNDYSKTIIGFMIKLSKDLNLKCIIEGVETAEQAETINLLGGNIIQGYYISRAVPDTAAITLLSAQK